MYALSVETTFSAAHSITIRGVPEPLHGHNWRVVTVVRGESLDSDGLLCDFHEIEESLQLITRPFANRNLNQTPPFDRVNPTAEHVARHIGDHLAHSLPKGISLESVSVTEAPGCTATYSPAG